MKYQHIVWDWNGTLLNDCLACTKAVSEMLQKRGMGTLSLEEYRQRIVFPVINLYYESGFDLEKESYEDICDEYIHNYKKNISLMGIQEDARPVLECLEKKGLKQHIVSASGIDILIYQVQSYGLKDYFIHILGQKDNAAESKAHLAHKLKELTDCKPGEVLFIGDTVHDYEVAKEAGFDCALVANGHCSRSRLEATGAPVYGNLTELYEAVFK